MAADRWPEILASWRRHGTIKQVSEETGLAYSTVRRRLVAQKLFTPRRDGVSPIPVEEVFAIEIHISATTLRGLNAMARAGNVSLREVAQSILKEVAAEDE